MFDDSFIHEVYHFGSEPRYVLYTSVWHPEVLEAEKKGAAEAFLNK